MQTLNKKVFRRGDSSIYAYEGKWKVVPGSLVQICPISTDPERPFPKLCCDAVTDECVSADVWFGCWVGSTYLRYLDCEPA